MKTTKTAVVAFVALTALAACGRADNETVDTMVVPGVDTSPGMAMPTTDTIVKTITTDTISGQRRDTTKLPY